MKQVSELVGAELDYWTAKAEGMIADRSGRVLMLRVGDSFLGYIDDARDFVPQYSPSTNWAQGGRIIERERISVVLDYDEKNWLAGLYGQWGIMSRSSETPLIAAMRCFVASKFGNTVNDVLQEQGGN